MGKLFIGKKAVGEFDAARVTGQHIQLNNFISFDVAPLLNENQQIVLKWLQEKWNETQGQLWFPFEVLNSLHYQFDKLWGEVEYDEYCVIVKDKPYIEAYGDLTAVEQLEVLQAFSQWAQEQEEE